MYCTKCGKEMDGQSRLCTSCGAPIEQQTTKQQTTSTQAEPSRKKGFFDELLSEMLELLRHPKKLIPTFVLAVIWIVMPLVTGFAAGANIPIVRFFCTLTYANGGILGGFFGTVGGIFGKAVFVTVVNGFVLSLCAKKNPFKGVKKGFGGVFAGGLKAISPLLIGGGTGLVLYWFFNITSAPQNCAIAVVAAVAAIQAVGKQNGLLFGGVFYLLKKLSKGKAPSKITISRILTGLSTGFAIGFVLTFLRYAWIIAVSGIVLLGIGIGITLICKNGIKRAAATAALVFMLSGTVLPFMKMTVFAEADTANGYWKLTDIRENADAPKHMRKEYSSNSYLDMSIDGENGKFVSKYSIVGSIGCDGDNLHEAHDCGGEYVDLTFASNAPKNSYQPGEEICLTLQASLSDSSEFFCDEYIGYIQVFYRWGKQQYNTNSLMDSQSRDAARILNAEYQSHKSTSNEVITNINVKGTMPQEPFNGYTEDNIFILAVATADSFSHTNDRPWAETIYEYTWQPGTTPVVGGTTDDNSSNWDNGSLGTTKGEDGYVPYRGRLTYTSGITNKHGQPFPDIMDFNNDGYIDYTDLAIRQKLVHNPDFLDTPQGAVLVVITLVTTVIGIGAGTAAGVVGSAAEAGASFGRLNLNVDFSEDEGRSSEEKEYEDMIRRTDRYISTDEVGDLVVRDPVTGVERHYIKQQDGSYRQIENGQDYTKDEIRNDLAYVERNSEYYTDVESTRAKADEYQRKHASELSEDGKKMAEMMRQEKAEAEHQDKLDKIGAKHGIYSGDEAEIREKMAKDQAFEEQHNERLHVITENIDTMVNVAEVTEKIADISMDALETVTGPTGKVVNAAYKVTKGAAGKGAEAYSNGEDITKAALHGAFEGGVDAATGQLSGTAKAGATVAGETAKGALDAYMNDGDIAEGAKSGLVKGVASASIDAAGDAVADAAKVAATKDVSSTITNAISNESAKGVASTVKTVTRGVDVGNSVAGNLAKNYVNEEISFDNKSGGTYNNK